MTSYIGGNEHAVLHLLYSRFITMVLHDAGYLDFEEPYASSARTGMIIRERREDVEEPRQRRESRTSTSSSGAPTHSARYLMFLGPYEEGGDFRDQSIAGVRRFLDRCGRRSSTRSPRTAPPRSAR